MSASRVKTTNHTRGFTLVELLVTISIFAVLTGVVLLSQARFNSTILLTNLAYDTALTIRQAQTYGINIKNFTTDGTDNRFVPYGVHFNKDLAPTSFILFADMAYTDVSDDVSVYPGDDLTTCDVDAGCVNRYSIKRGNMISEICATVPNVGENCGVEELDILFKRPSPDAIIIADALEDVSKVKIKLGDADAEGERVVVVQTNGLIYIENR